MMSELPSSKQSDFIMRVWEDLSSIDLTGYTKTLSHAGNATYLSWSNAWTLLMQRYPHSMDKYKIVRFDNGTVEVRCKLTVSDGENQFTRSMFLPCMNSKNQSINDPDSRCLSDTKQRSFVKCLAKFGLGIQLYASDGIPKLEKAENIPTGNVTDEQVAELSALLGKTNSNPHAFLKVIKCADLSELPAAKFKQAYSLLETKLKKMEKAA
jgi:hypothetical protein